MKARDWEEIIAEAASYACKAPWNERGNTFAAYLSGRLQSNAPASAAALSDMLELKPLDEAPSAITKGPSIDGAAV
jgi:hypothetical protein